MQFNEVDWAPVFIALAIGAAVGIVLVVSAMRRKSAARAVDSQLLVRDLEGQRDNLVSQLQELEDAAAKLSADELRRTRLELELKLAATLRDIGDSRAAAKRPRTAVTPLPPAGEVAEAPAADRLATARGFLWGIGGAAAMAGLIVFVLQTAEPKEQSQAMGGAQEAGMIPDAALTEMQATVQANPDNLDLRVELARAYLLRNDMMAVWNETKFVLDRVPGHPRALSYAALVRFQMNEQEEAISMLQTALATDPTLLDGWIHLAIVLNEAGRHGEAKAVIAEGRQKRPDQAPMFDSLLSEIEQRAHPEQAQTAAAPPADPSAAVVGVVEVGSGAASPGPNASLFLIARDAAAPAGPPVAVKRMSAATFPLPFQLDGRDSMMGQPLPAKMIIEARIDTDGSPTLSAGELSGTAQNVALGTTDVQLVLQ